jgi:hypothetical protein
MILSPIEALAEGLLLRWMHIPGLPDPELGAKMLIGTDLGPLLFVGFAGGALWGSINLVRGADATVIVVLAHSRDLTEEERGAVRAELLTAHSLDLALQGAEA